MDKLRSLAKMVLLTDNSQRFVSTFFKMLWTFLEIKQPTNIKYHSHSNNHEEYHNRIIAARLRHYLPSIHAIFIYSYSHAYKHSPPKYTGPQEGPQAAWSHTIKHLGLPINFHCKSNRLKWNPKHHRKHSATDRYTAYPKCGTTTTSHWKLLNSATSITKTPEGENRRHFAQVHSFMSTAPLWTYAPGRTAREAYSKLLPRTVGYYGLECWLQFTP